MTNDDIELPKRKDEINSEAVPTIETFSELTSLEPIDTPMTINPEAPIIPSAEELNAPIAASPAPIIESTTENAFETPVNHQNIIIDDSNFAPVPADPIVRPVIEDPIISPIAETPMPSPIIEDPALTMTEPESPIVTEVPLVETSLTAPAPVITPVPETPMTEITSPVSGAPEVTKTSEEVTELNTGEEPKKSKKEKKEKKLKKSLQKEKQIQVSETGKKSNPIAGIFTLIIIVGIIIAAGYFFVMQGIIELPTGWNLPFMPSTTTTKPNGDNNNTVITLPGVYKESERRVCKDTAAVITLKEDNTFIFSDLQMNNNKCDTVKYEGTYAALDGVLTLTSENKEFRAVYVANLVTTTITITGTAGTEMLLYRTGDAN